MLSVQRLLDRNVMCLSIGGFVLCLCLVQSGCSSTTTLPVPPTSAEPPWFEDVTSAWGLGFVHDPGPIGKYRLPQITGSGVALLDFDGDGRLDLYLIHNAGPKSDARNRLYRQGADGRFVDVSDGSGVDVAGFGMGAAVGDVNNDGRPDLLVTEHARARLFLNLGDGKFRDISAEAGIDNPVWGTSAVFFDYDQDGWLDLAIANYVEFSDTSVPCGPSSGQPDFCHPNTFRATVDRLFRNCSSGGAVRFEDVTLRAGLASGTSNGLGVVAADFSGDGRPDLLVASDAQPNRLWIQQPDRTFKDEAHQRGIAVTGMGTTAGNMGIAMGDVDRDGLFDIFITHLLEESHTLWRQEPRGYFHDRTVAHGLTATKWRGTGFGAAFADFDHDGWLDLMFVNGRVYRRRDRPPEAAREKFWHSYHDRNQLFAGAPAGKLRDISPANAPLCELEGVFRSLAVGDIDNDGALDAVVTQIAGPTRIFRNVAPRNGHWIGFRVVDPKLRRDALGAEIRVRAGERTFVGLVHTAGSYLSSSDPRVHFGLGPCEQIEAVEVRWPDGVVEAFAAPAFDRYVELRRGEGRQPAGAKP